MAIEFLGSKGRLLSFLTEAISKHSDDGSHFVDLFCGTASVSSAFRSHGLRVTANDHLALCSTMAEARLLNRGTPRFAGVLGAGEVSDQGGKHPYDRVLARLNGLGPKRGFVFRSYSPASLAATGVERMYFTEANAAQIDAIRAQISHWNPLLTRGERSLLIADLVRAASERSNTAGTYGCFLKSWKPRALEPIELSRSRTLSRKGSGHAVFRTDAESLMELLDADIVYADPPYTKRQYAAYYHVLETIVCDDKPALTGKTGLRPWASASSEFCYRRRAPGALENLIRRIRASHFFMSYSSDGQMPDSTIREVLGPYGRLAVSEVPYQRYRSSARRHRGPIVTERLYHLALA